MRQKNKTKYHFFYIMLIIMTFFGCHMNDKRLVFYNKTTEDVVVRFLFDREFNADSINVFRTNPFRGISNNEKEFLLFNTTWDDEFKYNNPDSLNVIVFKDFNFIINNEKDFYRVDSTYKENKIAFRKYSLENLKKNNWEIIYPDDNFVGK